MAVAMDNAILENILRQVRPLIGQGKVADYIPALATVDGSRLGIAICTVDGQLFQAGDAQERFSIQSISKVLSLVVAMRHYSEEEIWQRVGKDPSGSPFNSLVQLEMEQGIPRNPFINAGALVVCDMLQGRLSAPRQRMLEVVRGLSGVSDISYDTVVARSEFEHSARNAAIAWLMKSFGNFHHDVTTVLQNYSIRAFSLLMQSLDPLFARLSRSKFRSRFRLGVKERQYCLEKGAPVIEQHAADFVAKRLAPALPANDGKQTPMRGHPVFIAQHATATCCRGCLAKWHNIPQGEALSEEQQRYIVTVIYHWLVIQMNQP